MVTRRWLAVPVAAIALAGCGSAITSGTVTGKQDIPAHNTTIYIPQYRTQCTTEEEQVGNQEEPEQVCTQVISYYLPMPQYVPEDWQLRIRDGQRTGWVDVSQSVYNHAQVGKHWTAVTS